MAMVGQYGTSGNIGNFLTTPATPEVPPRPGGINLEGGFKSMLGIGEAKYNEGLAKDRIEQLRKDYQDAVDAAQAGNITGGVYGDTNFNANTKTLDFKGNEQFQNMLTGLYNQTNNYETADPYQLAEKLYDYNTPNREKFIANQQNQLDERLNARGMGFSSSGNEMFGELAQSQMMAMNDERMKSLLTGQEIANSENARYQSAITALNNTNTGVINQNTSATNLGVDVAQSDGLAAAYTNQAATKQKTGSGIADILGIAGGAVAGPVGSMFGKIAGSFFS
jgi:hypothetical protein